jgi:hypothetical protein
MHQFDGRAEAFEDVMSLFTKGSGSGYGPEALLDYIETNGLTDGTLVNVGGSHGSASIPIVQQHQNLRVIVQDQVAVVEVGAKNVPGEVRDRVRFMAHDFFTEQPVKGAEVYLLRWILHD